MNAAATILVVDDIESNRDTLRDLLEADFRIIEAPDGPSALQLASETQPDLVLLDVMMPGMDGFELCRRMRADEHLAEAPVIMVTALDDQASRLAGIEAGADDFVTKPFNRVEMRARVRTITRLNRYRRLHESRMALSESESRFIQLSDCMPVIGWSAKPDGFIDYYNKRWYEVTGLPESDGGDESWTPVIHPEDLKKATERWYASVHSGQSYELKFRLKDWKSGSFRWQIAQARPIRTKDGKIIRWYGTCTDIHKQKLAEESDRRLASIIESSQDAIISKTLDGVVMTWNHAAERIYGYVAEEMVGQSISKLLSTEYQQLLPQILATLKSGESLRELVTHEVRKDGTPITVSLSISPIKDDFGSITSISMIARDISEHKRLEDQLRQSQKMDAVGRLAGGVAHDFNNLLTVILGRAELTDKRPGLDDSVRRNIKLIHQTATRAAVLTRQLLQFSRQQVLQPQVLELNSIVPDMQEMLRRLVSEDIDLIIKLNPKAARIKADPGQIEQVVMNLVVNARDAMPNGGKLTIQTSNVDLDEEYCRTHEDATPGEYVMLSVGDTGSGMDENTRAYIFEPFFTTKEMGKGTGLGLSTVYGIVKQAGGNIYVYSEIGQGTIFKVYFPAVTEQVHGAKTSSSLPATGGGETILLVEDEDGIRELLNEILMEKGYTVLLASDGEQAIQCSKDHKKEIHLLLTDVVMPKMNGKEVAVKLSQKRGDLKVLFMSGYTSETIINRGVLDEGIEFLEKPFTPQSVALRVRAVLDSSSARFACDTDTTNCNALGGH